MKRQSPSLPQPNDGSAPTTSASYEVVGLVVADHMPLVFNGQTFDLARLTDQELETLLAFPDQVPFLRKL